MAPLRLIPVAAANILTRVEAPDNISFEGGVIPIVVVGEPGTRYILNVDKKESLTSGVTAEPVAVDGVFDLPNYDFLNEKFTIFSGDSGAGISAISGKEKQLTNGFVLDSTGKRTHSLKLNETSASRRLDVTLQPITKKGLTTKFKTTAPTKAGSVSMIQRGINTLSITPITYDNTSNFGTLPSAITISKPERFDNDPYRTSSQRFVRYRGGTAGVSSTRIVLQTNNANVRQGMLVTGDGVAHLTTVASVNSSSIILSAAATVTDGTLLRFDTIDANVKSFSFTITPGAGATRGSLDVIDYSGLKEFGVAVAGFNRPLIVGGTNIAEISRLTLGSISDSTTMVLAINLTGLVTGQGLRSVMSMFPSSPTYHGTRNVLPGMGIFTEDGTPLTALDGTSVTVASVTNHTTLVLSAAVTIPTVQTLTFKPLNPDTSTFGLSVDKVSNNVVVSGYLKVTKIKNTGIIPVYLDSIIEIS